MSHHQHANCIEACDQCASSCDHCSTACLQEPNVSEMTRCIQLDMDCADICRLTSALMARNSTNMQPACLLCAQICDACADECDKYAYDHCQECAKACRRCAEECRKMAA